MRRENVMRKVDSSLIARSVQRNFFFEAVAVGYAEAAPRLQAYLLPRYKHAASEETAECQRCSNTHGSFSRKLVSSPAFFSN